MNREYRSRLRTSDLIPVERVLVGGKRHTQVVDLITSLGSEEEEDLLRLVLHGWTQQDIASEFGVTQGAISKRLRKLLRNAL